MLPRAGIGKRRPAKILRVLDDIHHPGLEEEAAVCSPGDERDSGFGEGGPQKAQGGKDDEKIAQSAPPDGQERLQTDIPAGRIPGLGPGRGSRLCLTAEKGKIVL